jgi:hypothetical protein
VNDALSDLPEAPAMFERASDLVSGWNEANGMPLLSPEASRDLTGRITLALIEAQTEVALYRRNKLQQTRPATAIVLRQGWMGRGPTAAAHAAAGKHTPKERPGGRCSSQLGTHRSDIGDLQDVVRTVKAKGAA